VLEGLRGDPFRGGVQYTLSHTGAIAYVPGGYSAAARALVWVDRRGEAKPVTETRQAYYDPRFSPDGKRLAIGIEGANHDIWLYEIAQGTLTRLTFGPNWDGHAIWTPDGKHVTFASAAPGNPDLFGVPSDGSREPERLLPSEHTHFPSSWSPDGKVLAFEELHPGTGFDIWMLPVEGERKPRPFLRTPFEEAEPRFSPDGRHIAYTSDESGRREVYVQSYPGPGGKLQISTEGGAEPVWRPDGREIFYRNGSKMMAVSIETKPEFEAKAPRLLFEGNYEIVPLVGADYDVTPDGERFVMIAGDPRATVTQLNVVLNWFEELKRRVPPGKN